MFVYYLSDISVFSYLKSELTRGYMLERDECKYAERRERVYTFMKTPRELEKVFIKNVMLISINLVHTLPLPNQSVTYFSAT